VHLRLAIVTTNAGRVLRSSELICVPFLSSAAQSPISISRKPFLNEKSMRIVLFVSNNPASRKALRMAKILMQNDANHLRIAHVVASQQGEEPQRLASSA
jgi:hypothetical protein